jgi:hypothetical protein
VANGRRRRRFLAWWLMEGEGEGSWLGGQWKEKVLGLVANGRRRRRFFFYLFPFFPQATYFNFHFLSLTLRFYFAPVLGHYLRLPFVFLGL